MKAKDSKKLKKKDMNRLSEKERKTYYKLVWKMTDKNWQKDRMKKYRDAKKTLKNKEKKELSTNKK